MILVNIFYITSFPEVPDCNLRIDIPGEDPRARIQSFSLASPSSPSHSPPPSQKCPVAAGLKIGAILVPFGSAAFSVG